LRIIEYKFEWNDHVILLFGDKNDGVLIGIELKFLEYSSPKNYFPKIHFYFFTTKILQKKKNKEDKSTDTLSN
jgi:hypothetical protein